MSQALSHLLLDRAYKHLLRLREEVLADSRAALAESHS